MLIETEGSNSEHDSEKLHKFLQKAMDKSLACDGFVTNEPGKMAVFTLHRFLTKMFTNFSFLIWQNIWLLRDNIASAIKKTKGYYFSYDISLPLSHFYEIVPETRKRVGN